MGTELQRKVDRTALIQEMSAALKTASDRWTEVCRIYSDCWNAAYDNHIKVLDRVRAIKQQRELAKQQRARACIAFAFAFLPIIGGEIAISLAPILTARGRIFVSALEKRAQTAWTEYAFRNPIRSFVVKEIGTRSAKEAAAAATRIKEGIIEKLMPNYQVKTSTAISGNPVNAFIDNEKLTQGFMNQWVQGCAKWNVKGGWERELVPVAHDMFLNHPWIKKAPPEEKTQSTRAWLPNLIEMAIWLKWARQRDEPYWKNIHDWYATRYDGHTYDGKRSMVSDYRKEVVDALDFAVLWEHMRWQFPKHWFRFESMKLLDPESGGIAMADRTTIDMYQMIKVAKSHMISSNLLRGMLPNGAKIDYHLFSELSKV